MFFRFHLSEMATLAFFLSDSTYSPGSMSNNFAPGNLRSPWQPRTCLNSKCLLSILWKLLLYRFLDISHVVLITQYCKDLNFKFNLGNYRKYMVVTKIKFTSIPVPLTVVLQISFESESLVAVNKCKHTGSNLDWWCLRFWPGYLAYFDAWPNLKTIGLWGDLWRISRESL